MQRLSRFHDSTHQNSRTAYQLANCIFLSKMGRLIGKSSQLRSRSLHSLTACKFSSHSSEHRRRSYELCRSACMARKNNHVIPLSQQTSYAMSHARYQAIDHRGLLRMPLSKRTLWSSSAVAVLSRMSTSAWREWP